LKTSSISSGSAKRIVELEDGFSNLFPGNKPGAAKNLNAKKMGKLDIDFDNDDFFSSFEPKIQPKKAEEVIIKKAPSNEIDFDNPQALKFSDPTKIEKISCS